MFKFKSSALKNELNAPQKVIMYLFLLICFLLMILPMWNVIVVSTSTRLASTSSGVKLWWSEFSMEGYEYVFRVANMGKPFLNSLYVTLVGVIMEVILASFAGYVLIQKELPGKTVITSFIMVTMMIPVDLTSISIYQMNKSFHLTNTYTGLIINGLISGFAILLMRNYFVSVPYSLAESSRLDGASEFRIFFQIFLPISLPGLATVFFMQFVSKWNSITLPAVLITEEKKYTLPLLLKSLIIQTEASQSGGNRAPQNAIMAAVVISTIPLLLIYVFSQQFLLSGMTLGASKE